ncbi:chorismate mutase [Mycolicibacterium hodleri]|uniref:Chorismate mutase n=1 Tax=Mycolicibacterium hodleri TaxID=49897 RepID=A0A502EC37_9MYCO|nr:chorismate mutase [Mycolicibacterium hodleri]TPG34894.1 chorismate mutase [Mycolicibacterium hodleri]
MTVTALARHVGSVVVGAALALMATSVHADADEPAPLFALVDAAAQRLLTADAVAASKWATGAAIEDPARERQVIEAVTAAAGEKGVDSGYVARAFRNQIDATVAVQYDLFSGWKLDPVAAPTTAPDLSDSRAAIDTLNRAMVSEIAGQWDALHSPLCLRDLDAARSAVVDERSLDDIYRRALTFATRSYCP